MQDEREFDIAVIAEGWRKGLHRNNKKGEIMDLAEMSKGYLHNTIGYFKKLGADVSPLEAEYKKRK